MAQKQYFQQSSEQTKIVGDKGKLTNIFDCKTYAHVYASKSVLNINLCFVRMRVWNCYLGYK